MNMNMNMNMNIHYLDINSQTSKIKFHFVPLLLPYISHHNFKNLHIQQVNTYQKMIQSQRPYQLFIHTLLNSDPLLQNLFYSPQNLLNDNEQYAQIQGLSNLSIKIDRQQMEKGYMSEGQEKEHYHRPKPRKNSLIHKMKIKQRKKKAKETKIYIEMLENRVLQLQKSLETSNKLNEMNREYVKKLSEGEHIMNGLFVSKQRQIENLEFLLKQKEVNQEALKKQYSNMRFRQGVYGKDRTKAINYYFSEMSELFFSDTLKYLIKTAQNEEDFFDPQLLRTGIYSNIKSSEDIVGLLKLPNESINQLSYLKEEILAEKKNLDVHFENFYKSKCDILRTSRKLEMIIDSMQRYCNQEQISRLIVFADQYRFKKNISVKEFYREVFDKLGRERYEYDPENLFGRVSLN